MTRYILRLDDIAPNMNWDRYFALKTLFDKYQILPLLGVIPDNQDPDFLKLPHCSFDFWGHIRERQQAGWDIALHGCHHRYHTENKGLLGINARSEFAGLSYEDQYEKINHGLSIFATNGINTRIFMAPAHSYDKSTLRVLKTLGIDSITDGFSLFPYLKEGILYVPQLFATPRSMPFGVYTFCLHLNTMDDKTFKVIERFVQKEKSKIISFASAKAYALSHWLQQPIGLMLKRVLLYQQERRRRKIRIYKPS